MRTSGAADWLALRWAALLDRMVHAGTVCVRRLTDGKRAREVRFNRFLPNRTVTIKNGIDKLRLLAQG